MPPCLSDSFSDTMFCADGTYNNIYAGNQCSVSRRQNSSISEFSPKSFGDSSLTNSPDTISPMLFAPMHKFVILCEYDVIAAWITIVTHLLLVLLIQMVIIPILK